MFRLPRKIPQNIAAELILTGNSAKGFSNGLIMFVGDPIKVDRAYQLGLINKICPPGKALQEAMALANRIVVNAPLAVFEARRVVWDALTKDEEERAWEESDKAFPFLTQTEDFLEGPRAFIEKRPPRWTGKL